MPVLANMPEVAQHVERCESHPYSSSCFSTIGRSTTTCVPWPVRLRMRHLPPSSLALADAFQAELAHGRGLDVKAAAPVADLDPKPVSQLHEADAYLVGPAVLRGIR